jgi:AcrR family transcriptional regulator
MKKAVETRQMLLQKAFELIYVKGYQATSLDDILATTQVTKGAFYYHFKNKEEMGLAVIQELMVQATDSNILQPVIIADDPLKAIYEMMRFLLLENPILQSKYGCPTHNLIQEMAPLNPQFKEALSQLVQNIQKKIQEILENAQNQGIIRKNMDTRQVTCFIHAGYAGIRNVGKLYENTDSYDLYLQGLKAYLESLR